MNVSAIDIGKVAAAAVPVIVASIALASVLRGWYRRTIGRRREMARRLQRLGTGVQRSYFEAVLEAPPTFRRRLLVSDAATEWTWIDRDLYLQAIVDQDEEVLAYYVVSRSRRFRPRFRASGSGYMHDRRLPPGLSRLIGHPSEARTLRGRVKWRIVPLYDVRLGKTPLAAAAPEAEPLCRYSAVGARLAMFAEYYEFGNPGAFQTFVVGLNSAGHLNAPPVPVFADGQADFEKWGTMVQVREEDQPEISAFRAKARANVFGVIAPDAFDTIWRLGAHTPGPHLERVRTVD